jgi:predicted nucleic-acid-binding protein
MNKDKQIEKMEKDIPAKIFVYDLRENSANIDEKHRRIVAELLYNRGYRKASEVVEEVIRILRAAGINEHRYPVVAELKKKYTEGEG